MDAANSCRPGGRARCPALPRPLPRLPCTSGPFCPASPWPQTSTGPRPLGLAHLSTLWQEHLSPGWGSAGPPQPALCSSRHRVPWAHTRGLQGDFCGLVLSAHLPEAMGGSRWTTWCLRALGLTPGQNVGISGHTAWGRGVSREGFDKHVTDSLGKTSELVPFSPDWLVGL